VVVRVLPRPGRMLRDRDQGMTRIGTPQNPLILVELDNGGGMKTVLMSELSGVAEQRNDYGVACGGSFIPHTRKCSPEKARNTTRRAREATALKARAAKRLAAQSKTEGRGKVNYTKGQIRAEVAKESGVRKGQPMAATDNSKAATPGWEGKLQQLSALSSPDLSPDAQQIIKKAVKLDPTKLKAGQEVKLLQWDREGAEGVDLSESSVKITGNKNGVLSYKPVKANEAGLRKTRRLEIYKDGTISGGEVYPADSEPVKAFRLRAAQNAKGELPTLKTEAEAAAAKAREATGSDSQGSYAGAVNRGTNARERLSQAKSAIKIGEELQGGARKPFFTGSEASGYKQRTTPGAPLPVSAQSFDGVSDSGLKAKLRQNTSKSSDWDRTDKLLNPEGFRDRYPEFEDSGFTAKLKAERSIDDNSRNAYFSYRETGFSREAAWAGSDPEKGGLNAAQAIDGKTWNNGKGSVAMSLNKGVTFWRDGKPSSTTGSSNAVSALRNLGAEEIDVQFDTKYDVSSETAAYRRLEKIASETGYTISPPAPRNNGGTVWPEHRVLTMKKVNPALESEYVQTGFADKAILGYKAKNRTDSAAACSKDHGWEGTKGNCQRLSPSRLPSSLPKPASTKRPAIRILNKEEYKAKLKPSAKLLGVAALMQFTGPALRIGVSNALARAATKKGLDPRLVRNLSRAAMQALGATGEYLRANPDANDRSAKDSLKGQLKSAAIAEKDRQLVKTKAKIVERAQQQLKRTDAADMVESAQDVEEFAELLLALMLADEGQRRSDSLPLPSDRLDRACAPNWHGTYPGGCKRGREPGSNSLRSIEKGGKKSKARQERLRRIKELRESGVMPGGQKKKSDAVTKEIVDRQNGILKLLGLDRSKKKDPMDISLEDLNKSDDRLRKSARMFGIDWDKITKDGQRKTPEQIIRDAEASAKDEKDLAEIRRFSLEASTPQELRKKAKTYNIPGRSKMKKADLVNAIITAEDKAREASRREQSGERKPDDLTYGDIVRARESAAKKLTESSDPIETFINSMGEIQEFIKGELFGISFNRKAKTAKNDIKPYTPIKISPETRKGAKEIQQKLAEANFMAIALAAEKAKRDAIKKTLFSPDSKLNGAAVGNKIKRFRRQLDSLDFELRTDGLELLETMLSPLSALPLPSYRVDGGALPLPSRLNALPLPSYRLDRGLGISRKKGERGGKRCGKGWTSKDNDCEDKNVNRKLSRREKLKLANSIRRGRGLLPRPSNTISAQQRQAIQAMNPREKLAFANRIRVSRGLRPLTMGEMKKTARPGLLKSQKQATNELLGVGLPVEPMKVVRAFSGGEEMPRGYFTVSGKDGRGLDARSLRAQEEARLNRHTGLDRYGNDQTNRSRTIGGYMAPPVDPKKPWGKRDLDDHLEVGGWSLLAVAGSNRDERADNARSVVAKAAGIAASAGTKQMSIRLNPETARDIEALNDPRFRVLRDRPFTRERGLDLSLTKRRTTGRTGKDAQYQLIANIVDGKPVAPTLAEVKAAKSRQILDRLKDLQFESGVVGVYTKGAESGFPNFGAQEAGPEKLRLGIGLTQQFAAEERLARSVEKLERRLIPRPEGKGNADFNLTEVRTAAKAAKAWNKAQGFAELKPGDTVNGFSAAQALAHDIAHPIALKAVGKNSEQLKQSYGVKTLVPEEAIVNAFEHLSRGDTLDASIQSGMRLSRVLARQDDVSVEEAAYYRSPEFAKKVREDVERGYMDKDHHLSMALIRNKNRVADTVFQGGEDFNNAPDAGPFRRTKNAAEQNEGLFEMAKYAPQTILVGSKGTKERMAQIREAAKDDFDFLDDLEDLGL
jgi:hypothetical protein